MRTHSFLARARHLAPGLWIAGLMATGSVHAQEGGLVDEAGGRGEVSLDDVQATLELDPSWQWTVEAKAMVWVPGLSGDLEAPFSSSVDVESLNADETRVTPAGRISIVTQGWTIRLRGFGFSLQEDNFSGEAFTLLGTPVAVGQRVSTDLSFSSFDATAGFRVWTPVEDVDRDVRVGFDLYGGARLHWVDVDLSTPGTSTSFNQTWIQPIVGVRMTLDLPNNFLVEFSVDGGTLTLGDNESFSFDITAAFQWRFHDNVGVEIGFRHHQFELITDDGADRFDFDGSLAGLYGALVIRF